MSTHRVVVPKPDWVVVRFRQEGHSGVAKINRALARFEPKKVFAWHLSVMVHLEELVDHGVQSPDEMTVVAEFERMLDTELALIESKKPNGLLLARITWHGTHELIYRVYDAELADSVLKRIIELKSHPRPFDYRMDNDPDWLNTQWHLDAAESNSHDQARA